jgi:hypothetical protein
MSKYFAVPADPVQKKTFPENSEKVLDAFTV